VVGVVAGVAVLWGGALFFRECIQAYAEIDPNFTFDDPAKMNKDKVGNRRNAEIKPILNLFLTNLNGESSTDAPVPLENGGARLYPWDFGQAFASGTWARAPLAATPGREKLR
jgi:hypothetical protein